MPNPKIEYGPPGIAGVKSLQYLGDDDFEPAGKTAKKVAGGALLGYGVYRGFRGGLDAAIGVGSLALGWWLWRH